MASKLEKLTQRIADLKVLIASRAELGCPLQEVDQALDAIASTCQTSTLRLHLGGIHPVAIQGMASVLEASGAIARGFEITTFTLDWALPESSGFQSNEEGTGLTSLPEGSLPKGISACDVLGVVIPADGRWAGTIAQFFQHLSHHPIHKRVLILDRAGCIPDADEEQAIAQCLHAHGIDATIDIFTLDMSMVGTQSDQAIDLSGQPMDRHGGRSPDKAQEKALSRLYKLLESMVARRPEDILFRRLREPLVAQIAVIEQVLLAEKETLEQTIQRVQSQIQVQPEGDRSHQAKAQLESTLSQLQQMRSQFFKQVHLELEQSRAQLLDDYCRSSVMYQIQRFTERLQPVIVRRGSTKLVQLQSSEIYTSTDVNMDLMQLCYGHLCHWLIDEWHNIYTCYGSGGLSQIFQTMYSTLSMIPALPSSLTVEATWFQPAQQQPSVGQAFRDRVPGILCETYYQENSILTYLIRQIRSQWMGVMFILTFITMIGIGDGNKREIIQDLVEKSLGELREQRVLLFIIIFIPLCIIFLMLFNNYHVNHHQKLQEKANTLRKNLKGHYQDFTKNLVNKFIQELHRLLELEEKRIQDILDYFQIYAASQFTQIDDQHQSIQNHLDRLNAQQQALAREYSALQKLSRI